MSWFIRLLTTWADEQNTSYQTSNQTAWKEKRKGAKWDDITVTWDSLTALWDDKANARNWYSKNNTDWQD